MQRWEAAQEGALGFKSGSLAASSFSNSKLLAKFLTCLGLSFLLWNPEDSDICEKRGPYSLPLFVSIRLTALAPLLSHCLSLRIMHDLPGCKIWKVKWSIRDPDPPASSLWDLPVYWLTHSAVYVNCVVKIQVLIFKCKLKSHISLMVGEEKPK